MEGERRRDRREGAKKRERAADKLRIFLVFRRDDSHRGLWSAHLGRQTLELTRNQRFSSVAKEASHHGPTKFGGHYAFLCNDRNNDSNTRAGACKWPDAFGRKFAGAS